MTFHPQDRLLSPSVFRDTLRPGHIPAFHGTQRKKEPNGGMSESLKQLVTKLNATLHSTNYNKLFTADRIQELFLGRFAYEEDEENYWQFHRLLGYGSFGVAAAYRKTNAKGEVSKQMVVKTEEAHQEHAVNDNRLDVSREAFHHAQVNKRMNYSNVFLHGYKYHVTDHLLTSPWNTKVEGFHDWRYYLEFCERGTLYGLYLKYKAWGYHLPESFIWWCFYWLVRSCRSLEARDDTPFLGHRPASFMGKWPTAFMLHNDLGWKNVFFQHEKFNPRHRNFWDRYPAPKFADFGLSTICGGPSIFAKNVLTDLPKGTPIFRPPERMPMEVATNFYPFQPKYPDAVYPDDDVFVGERIKHVHRITTAANLWGAAYLVYLLMTLDDNDKVPKHLERILVDETVGFNREEAGWSAGMDGRRRSGGLFLFREVETKLDEVEVADYSPELVELVLACTRLQPYKRPDLDDVERQIQAGMKQEAERLHTEFQGDAATVQEATRVVFDAAEWNKTPHGPFNFVDLEPGEVPEKETARFWHEFRGYLYDFQDPDDPPLCPPEPNVVFLPDDQFESDENPEGFNYSRGDGMLYVSERLRSLHQGPQLPYGGRACREDFDTVGIAEKGEDADFDDPDAMDID